MGYPAPARRIAGVVQDKCANVRCSNNRRVQKGKKVRAVQVLRCKTTRAKRRSQSKVMALPAAYFPDG